MPKCSKLMTLTLLMLLVPICAAAQQSDGSLSPESIGWPTYTLHGEPLVVPVTVANDGDAALTATVSTLQLEGFGTWLAVDQASLVIPALDQATLNVTINNGGVVNNPGTVVAWDGWVMFAIDPPTATDSLGLFVQMIVVDTIVLPQWDTLATSCLSMTVGNNANMGNQGVGGANMNFAADCDDSDTIPGDASVYLYDASPVIFNASDKGSWSMYSHRQPFWPYVSHQGIGQYDSDRFTGYFGGNQFDADSQLIVQTWLIAPKHVDSCDFMIHAFRVISTQGEAKDDLTIGFLVDWNIPSDSLTWNGYGEDLAGTYAYQQGLEFDQDNAVECQENNARFGGIKPLGYWDIANGTLSSAFDFNFAGPVVDSLMLPDGDLDPVKVNDLLNGGTVGEGPSTDRMTVATFFQSYDLAEGDTLTIFTVLAAVENGTQQDLAEVFDKAQEWVGTSSFLLSYPPEIGDTCCTMRGDVNNDGVVNLTDLTCFINPIFLHIFPDPCRSGCHWEANADVNADGNRTLTDLSLLVNHLFVTFAPLLPCR